MKIVNRETFLAMPVGTVFSKYQPHIVDELQIKGESLNNDFMLSNLSMLSVIYNDSDEMFESAAKDGASLEMDFGCQERDGCFEDDQLFCVLEPKDIRELIAELQECLPINNDLDKILDGIDMEKIAEIRAYIQGKYQLEINELRYALKALQPGETKGMHPVVMYFKDEAETEEFIKMVNKIKPNLRAKQL